MKLPARSLRALARWLHRRAENIAVAMLAAMFCAFVIQIVFRYFLNFPVGWTSELTVILWLWLVLWGSAFVLRESEEIRFDLLLSLMGRRARTGMRIVAAVALVVLYAASLPATWDYVTFMKVEKTAYLKIRFDWLFSIYLLFAVAVLARYLRILSRLLRGREPDESATVNASSGL